MGFLDTLSTGVFIHELSGLILADYLIPHSWTRMIGPLLCLRV